MEQRLAVPPGGRVHSLIATLIFGLDLRLRQHLQVFEYTHNPDCIFRIGVIRLAAPVMLSDGTCLEAGERIVDLHLWNEHIPVIPPAGASLVWARQMYHCLDVSLRDLAAYLEAQRGLDDVRAVRANMSFGTSEQISQLARISGRFGFEAVPDPRQSTVLGRLHLFGENILVSLLVLARNVEALRRDSLLRSRTQVFLPRGRLEARYRALPEPAAAPLGA